MLNKAIVFKTHRFSVSELPDYQLSITHKNPMILKNNLPPLFVG